MATSAKDTPAPSHSPESTSATGQRPLPSAFSRRAVVVGLLGAVLIGFGSPYATFVLQGSYMDLDFSTPGAIFLLFVLTALANGGLARINRRWALTPGECITVYIMMLVASAVQTMGLSGQLMTIITAPKYYASPDNHWQTLLQPHLNPALLPQDDVAIRYFYEGLPPGRAIPWGAWALPLSVWAPFLMALYLVMICMMVILRRQWVENERLVYPLTHLPLAMVEEGQSRRTAALYRDALMWMGFAVPLLFGSMKGLHHYFPTVPAPATDWSIVTFRQSQTMVFRVSFPMVGFFYLVEQQTAFSLWFFNVLFFIIRGALNVYKIGMTENLGAYGASSPVFAHIGMGAFLALVVGGLYTARTHLREVIEKALGPTMCEPRAVASHGPGDANEAVSYRVAFWGMALGLAFMAGWLSWSGMPLAIALGFLFVVFALFIGLTRVVAESGMAEAVAPTIAPGVIVSALGGGVVTPKGLMSLAMTYVWCSDIRTFVMASAANGLKLAERTEQRKRPLFGLMALAIVVSASLSVFLTMRWAYQIGGLTLNEWFFSGGPRAPMMWVESQFLNRQSLSLPGWILTGVGAGLMVLLASMRQRFLWWPFHPLGFAIAPVWIMDQQWMTILISWLCKVGIMRYGGVKAYSRARAFFLGLILGQFVTNGLWLIVDQLANGRGNQVFWI